MQTSILGALRATLCYFIQYRLLSLKTWAVAVVLWAYAIEVQRRADAATLGVVGGTVLLGVVAHLWSQTPERG